MALIDEIKEQPEVAARLLALARPEVAAVAEAVRAADPSHVIVAARGTSDHAAIYAQYAMGVLAGMSVGLAAPSVLSLYGAKPRMDRALVIGISQSGASPDVVGVIATARQQGAITLAITNTPASDLGTAAAFVIDLRAGPELAVAASKTYTATLTALAMLTASLAGTSSEAELALLPDALAAVLDSEADARAIARDQAQLDRCIVLGRGYHYATAREWALKLKELSYTLADPYSNADFMHGPVALIDSGFPIFTLAPTGATFADMDTTIDRLGSELDARLLVLSDDASARARGTWALPLPAGLPEWLMPVVSIIPGQLHAMHLTLAKGGDPETPRSIHKVTRTS